MGRKVRAVSALRAREGQGSKGGTLIRDLGVNFRGAIYSGYVGNKTSKGPSSP